MLGTRLALAFVLVLASCREDGPSLAPKWARWFSFRTTTEVAVSRSGRYIVAAGESSADVGFALGTPPPPRAWLAILDAEGELLADRSAQSGWYVDVDIDDTGRAYALRIVVDDPSDPDVPTIPYQLLVVASDGAERWALSWDAENGARVPEEVFALDEQVVVRAGRELIAYSAEGEPAWSATISHSPRASVAHADELWFAGNVQDSPGSDAAARSVAVRCEAGECDAPLLLGEPGLELESLDVDDEQIVAHQCAGPYGERVCRLARYSRDGNSLGHDVVERVGSPLIAAGGYWTIGSPRKQDRDDEGAIVRERRHLELERYRPRGGADFRTRRTFVEHEADAVDRSDCQATDIETNPSIVGSHGAVLHALGDGDLLLSGRQGCRDSFLLALEVSP